MLRIWKAGLAPLFAVVSWILSASNKAQVIGFVLQNPPLFQSVTSNSQHQIDRKPVGLLSATRRRDSESAWFPKQLLPLGVPHYNASSTDEFQLRSLVLVASLVQMKLRKSHGKEVNRIENRAWKIALGKFVDLCCTHKGEALIEDLFNHAAAQEEEDHIIEGAIVCMQSLAVLGSQYGLKGTPEQFAQWDSHLREEEDAEDRQQDYEFWDASSSRRLKSRRDTRPGLQLLAQLKWKKSAQGGFDLLVALGAWQKHENLALLRSGFPIRFSAFELQAAEEVINLDVAKDPDTILGIRRDLREQKVFTIDSASTCEIDDGLSIEEIHGDDGSKKYRIWIHIADAELWSSQGTVLFDTARKRATSHYLPEGSISMFPSNVTDQMSLTANTDSFALSLGVELAEDGSCVESSIVVTPSIVRVSYRLTYDDVDEMLLDGVGYREEWQLGALLAAATLRRGYRIRNGSSEAFVPRPIPRYSISTFDESSSSDGIGVAVNIDASHNSGRNLSSSLDHNIIESREADYESPVSSASTLVTEMMILAGEAIGKWKLSSHIATNQNLLRDSAVKNHLILPFRSQPKPDYRSRSNEKRIMMDLLSNNVGAGFCHAWYARRFLSPVKVDIDPSPHSGLGLQCYCQWTSPIRRLGDLLAHRAIKRFLRREAIFELLTKKKEIPHEIDPQADLGLEPFSNNGSLRELLDDRKCWDQDINYKARSAWLRAARILQTKSQQYWMIEHVRRLTEENPEKTFEAVVLGCTNPARRQYAIYLYELGLEWKYVSPVANLQAGMKFNFRVANALPRNGQLTFVRVDF